MLCYIVGSYSVYCGKEYVGHMYLSNDNTLGIGSSNPEKCDLEQLFSPKFLADKINKGEKMFSVCTQYGLFSFIKQQPYKGTYDYLYETMGYN